MKLTKRILLATITCSLICYSCQSKEKKVVKKEMISIKKEFNVTNIRIGQNVNYSSLNKGTPLKTLLLNYAFTDSTNFIYRKQSILLNSLIAYRVYHKIEKETLPFEYDYISVKEDESEADKFSINDIFLFKQTDSISSKFIYNIYDKKFENATKLLDMNYLPDSTVFLVADIIHYNNSQDKYKNINTIGINVGVVENQDVILIMKEFISSSSVIQFTFLVLKNNLLISYVEASRVGNIPNELAE